MINMKWMIASDIHGSAYYCRQLLNAYNREQADRLLLLGDLLYHGPRNDLPEEYDPKQVIELLNAKKQHILCVRGNCDAEVDQMVLQFPIMADYCAIADGDTLIYATHGHTYNEQNLPPLHRGDISATRTYPRPGMRPTRHIYLHESRICCYSKSRKLARLHDYGKWPFPVENND